jgi:dynein heavy chain
MFDNVAALKLVEDKKEHKTIVTGMLSGEKEEMDFKGVVPCKGRIEEWMNDVVIEMKRTNRFITKKSIFYFGKSFKSRVEWMLDFQGMVVLAANQVWWTAEVENVFFKVKQVYPCPCGLSYSNLDFQV